VTVEPGIYIPGKGGVRIEDLCIIKPGGHRNLCKASKELIAL
ncbi:MAG: aminopeptidase P family protein, partial [Christensenellaceae bacterium]|jgi:Xaa-Pro aminopeptidase|nr:aminopeptidase P family protein [Christensenellaceae bacterium]